MKHHTTARLAGLSTLATVAFLLSGAASIVSTTGALAATPVQLAANGHTCAVIAGGAKCWGDNTYGQLGRGGDADSSVPVDVAHGLTSGVLSVATGAGHSCAVLSGGSAACWGANNAGQLGDTSQNERDSPVTVLNLPAIKGIAAGQIHSCALTTTGGVKCWGDNTFGQLGNGESRTFSTVPVNVVGLSSGVKQVVTGSYNSCALTTAGTVKCWGSNDFGSLGNGSPDSSSTPVAVKNLTGVTSITAGGAHNCALFDGHVRCWGDNGDGQLGNGTKTKSALPVKVRNLPAARQISGGAGHTCAVTTAGAALCWGDNINGELGNGRSGVGELSTIPVNVSGAGSGIASIAAGAGHTCMALTSGKVKCWGTNNHGEVGDGTNMERHTPVPVVGLGGGGVAATSLTIKAPETAARGTVVAVKGKLVSLKPSCVSGKKVKLTFGDDHKSGTTLSTGKYRFTFTVPKHEPSHAMTVRVTFAGTTACARSSSVVKTITLQ